MEANDQIAAALANSDPVSIGKWTFHADSLSLECLDNRVKLEPRVAYLLYYLVENAGTPVSRTELMDGVWPGLVVGDEALTGAINKLRNAFGDDSHHPEVIRTIPKVGYQLIADVEFPNSAEAGDKPEPVANRKLGYALIALLVIAGTYFLAQRPESHPALDLSNKTSVAVLPFTNLSGDKSQGYFAVGMTEDIVTDLSKISGLHVIAFREAPPTRQELVHKYGIQYLLEGSVRRLADRVRVNAQLVRNEDGSNLWAERYDRELEDVFALQEELSHHIVGALSLTLTGGEQDLLSRPQMESFDAYDLFLQGRRHTRNVTRESNLTAQQLFERAIEADPRFARAYAALSVNHAVAYRRGWAGEPDKTLELAVDLAQKAASLDNSSPHILWALGYSYLFRKEYQKAIDSLEKAIHIAPSFADGYALLALINNNLGRYEQAAEKIRKAMAINPVYTFEYPYLLGWAYYGASRYEQAIEILSKAIERNESALAPHLFLAASYIGLDQQDDAEWEIEQIRVIDPEYSTSKYESMARMANEDELNRFLNDLRKAGLPD
jgi:TolB-like protein/Tfp pilus assembly protein PilF